PAGSCCRLWGRGDPVFPRPAGRGPAPRPGATPERGAGEARVPLQAGDMLIMVSDGILEARDARGTEYGLSRLSRRIRTARGGAEDVVKAILADLDGHAHDQAQGDDMTIVAMAIDERRAKRKTTTIPGVLPTDLSGPTQAASDDRAPDDDVGE